MVLKPNPGKKKISLFCLLYQLWWYLLSEEMAWIAHCAGFFCFQPLFLSGFFSSRHCGESQQVINSSASHPLSHTQIL